MATSDESTPHTGASSSSASRVSSPCAPETATPSPTRITGRLAVRSTRAASASSAGTGVTDRLGTVLDTTGSSVSWSSTSSGSDTNTGPRGGVIATFTARRITRSTEPGARPGSPTW